MGEFTDRRPTDVSTAAADADRAAGDIAGTQPAEMPRRSFLLGAGAAGISAAVLPAWAMAQRVQVIPNSEGFLLVDLKKCQGCSTCMMVCSLAHTGEASYTLSRIQIQQDSFQNWPDDIHIGPVPPVQGRALRQGLPGEADQGEQAERRSSAMCA